jgi:hypothetical protein
MSPEGTPRLSVLDVGSASLVMVFAALSDRFRRA